MNKENLRSALIEKQKSLITQLERKIEFSHDIVDLDELDIIDPEDYSHQSEALEMEELIQVQLQKAKIDLEYLKSIDFSPKTTIESGAFVQTEKFNFIIGFPTVPFDYEGLHIVGVSKASPIFPSMAGKSKGQSFEFSGKEYIINQIH
jgi:hypothetical protein